MSNEPPRPLGPFTLTRQRILLLAFGVLALLYIVGALMGGVGNYQQLREAAQPSSAQTPASSSSSP